MSICLDRIDKGYMQKQHNERTKVLDEIGNAATGFGKGFNNPQTITASLSLASGLGDGRENGAFKITKQTDSKEIQPNAAATRMSSGIPIRMAALAETAEKCKQAYGNDEVESGDTLVEPEEELLAQAADAFTVLYGCPLPKSLPLGLLKRFMDSLPMHDPKVDHISQLKRLIIARGEESELVIELFHGYVSRAEWLMRARTQCDSRGITSEAAKLIEEHDAKTTEEINKRADKEAAKIIVEQVVGPRKLANKDKEGHADKVGTGIERDDKLEKIPAASTDEVPNNMRPAKGKHGLFKTLAKAKVESTRKERGAQDEELVASETRAQSFLASENAAQIGWSENASKAIKKGSQTGLKNNFKRDHIRYKIKLAEENGEMVWPPMVANFKGTGFDTFLAYHGVVS